MRPEDLEILLNANRILSSTLELDQLLKIVLKFAPPGTKFTKITRIRNVCLFWVQSGPNILTLQFNPKLMHDKSAR